MNIRNYSHSLLRRGLPILLAGFVTAAGAATHPEHGVTDRKDTGAPAAALTEPRIQNITRVIKAARKAYPDNETMAMMAASQVMVEEGPDLKSRRFKRTRNCLGIKVPRRNIYASFKSLEDCLLGHRKHMKAPVYKDAWQAAMRGDLVGTIAATYEAGYAGDPQYVRKTKQGFSTYVQPVLAKMELR